MKLIIKSRQDYGTHVDEFIEEFPCSVRKDDKILKIEFENGTITIEENKIIQERGENKIVIEPDKTNECDYDTEQGMFVLDIRGIEVKTWNAKEGVVAKAKYEILMVGVKPYINEIEIVVT